WVVAGPKSAKTTHARHGPDNDPRVGRNLKIALAGAFSGVGLAGDDGSGMRVKQQAKAGANQGMVVDQQYADHACTSGISAIRLTPCGSWLATRSLPPRCSTRSARPRRPK